MIVNSNQMLWQKTNDISQDGSMRVVVYLHEWLILYGLNVDKYTIVPWKRHG